MKFFNKERNGKKITITDEERGLRITRTSIRDMTPTELMLFVEQEYSNMPESVTDAWAQQWAENLRMLSEIRTRRWVRRK